MQNITDLPDPFRSINGDWVRTKSDWACRQKEVNELFQRLELGTKPPRPSKLTASFSSNSLIITCEEDGNSISFNVSVSYPTTGKAPYPALIAYDGLSIPQPAGVAVLTFNNDDMAAQQNSSSRGVGKFYDLYGTNATASAMMAWAWGVSRIIDVLEMTPSVKINTKKLGVTGCSRNGKGALVAGAFDERIALTIPQESGSGGSACWRLSDYQLAHGQTVQTASEIVNENVWFSEEFANFSTSVDLLPFDHHMLAGLVAPRGLFVIDNSAILWLGPWSCYGCMKTANKIWQALGVPDSMGFSQIGNHSHCQFPASQQGNLTAFVNKFLFDVPGNTNIMVTDLNTTFDERQWADWQVPRLF